MAVRGNYYVTSGNEATDGSLAPIPANAMGLVEDPYQWAFIGNNYDGFKAINKAKSLADRKKVEAEAAAPTTKICPFCKSEINIEATRCPHCTSEQPKVEEKKEEPAPEAAAE
jgi:ribosomal protein L40E